MSLHFHWFLPTYGDSRNLMAGGHGSSMAGDRPATLRYLNQIGAAAESNGFESVLTPTGAWCEDAWLTTAMMLETTETLKFLVALRPGLLSPTLAAQMAATFQWQSQGRLLLNVVTGGEDHEQRTYGDYLDKNQRYARCGEFLDVIRQLWAGTGPVDYAGEYIRVENAQLQRIPDPVPPIFFGGSSPAAGTVASQFADTYLTWGGEPPSAVAGKIAWIRDLADVQGRTLDHGIRLHVISRDTSEEAWAEADRLLSALDPATVEQAQQSLARSGSEGQRRMRELHGGGKCLLEGRRSTRPRGGPPTCGPVSGWSAAAQAPRWSAPTRRSPIASPSTRRSGSITSSSPATRTSKRPSTSAKGSGRFSSAGGARAVAQSPPPATCPGRRRSCPRVGSHCQTGGAWQQLRECRGGNCSRTCAVPATSPTVTTRNRSTSENSRRRRGVSKYHFLRCFAAVYGRTPGVYLAERRVERAQDLLRATNLTVTEICHLVGYTSVGSFSAKFRQLVGTSPSGYQAKFAEHGAPRIPGCYVFMHGLSDRNTAISEKRGPSRRT